MKIIHLATAAYVRIALIPWAVLSIIVGIALVALGRKQEGFMYMDDGMECLISYICGKN